MGRAAAGAAANGLLVAGRRLSGVGPDHGERRAAKKPTPSQRARCALPIRVPHQPPPCCVLTAPRHVSAGPGADRLRPHPDLLRRPPGHLRPAPHHLLEQQRCPQPPSVRPQPSSSIAASFVPTPPPTASDHLRAGYRPGYRPERRPHHHQPSPPSTLTYIRPQPASISASTICFYLTRLLSFYLCFYYLCFYLWRGRAAGWRAAQTGVKWTAFISAGACTMAARTRASSRPRTSPCTCVASCPRR